VCFHLANAAEVRLQRLQTAEQDFAYGTRYSHLGLILAEQEHYEEALQAYREAVKREPGSATDYSNMGFLL